MTLLDVVIVVFALAFGSVGFLRGFVVSALSLAGFAAGAWLGTRLGPQLLHDGSHSPYAPVFGLLGALLAGTIIAAGLEGLGEHVRALIRVPGFSVLDGLLGMALSVTLALGMAWVLGVVALQTPGAREFRKDIQRSAILRRLNDALPSDRLLKALARFDPFPSFNGPLADVPAPRPAIARDPDVRSAAPSVVRVLGTACGLGVSGSGWVAAPGVIVTNAHVVAGEDDTQVQAQGVGPKLDATVVAFQPRNDIAVLRVDGLDAPSLRRASDVSSGEEGAVLGFPLNGPYDVRAARIAGIDTVLSDDAYGRGPVRRRIETFRGHVRPGNSGGPLVNADGHVAGTVFAASTSSRAHSGYAIPNEVVERILAAVRGPVDTGPCTG